MNHTIIAPGLSSRTTTSYTLYGNTKNASFLELAALGEHLRLCNKCSEGRLAVLHCTARAVQVFLATRFVTTLVVVGLVFGVGLMVR